MAGVTDAAAAAAVGWTCEATVKGAAPFVAVLFAVDAAVAVFRATPAHTLLKAEYRFVPLASLAALKQLTPPAAAAAGPGGGAASPGGALPVSFVRALSDSKSGLDGSGDGPLSDAVIARRLADAVARAAAKAKARAPPVPVTPAALALFDALAKTMECSWDADQILVLGTVLIKPPYAQDADVGLRAGVDLNAHAEAYRRVRTVFSKVRAQIAGGAPASPGGAPAPAAAPRAAATPK